MSFFLRGVIPALWTPTGPDGSLLAKAFERNIAFILQSQPDSLLVLGSTGEFIHLSIDERKHVLETSLACAASKPVLVNISHTNFRSAIELGRHAKESGAVAATLLPPWFFPLSDGDLVEFFVRIGEAIGIPLVLYNFKALNGKRLTPEVVREIATRIPILGIKHSAGEMQEHKALAELGREFGFNLITGWDTHIPEAMSLGAAGVVSGLANIVPDLVAKAYATSGGADQLKQLGMLLSKLEFPLNIAAAMEARGLQPGFPKSIVSAATSQRYANLRREVGIWLGENGYLPMA